MHIMAAGMHHPDFLPRRIFALHVTRAAHPGLFNDRQCVHVGADEQPLARPILEDCHHTISLRPILIFSDVLGDRDAGVAQLGCQ